MKWLLWPFRIIYCLYAYALFIALMLLFFPVIFVASFWGRIRGGNFIYLVLRFWATIWFPAIGIFHKNIYGSQRPNRKQQYIFVANHISYLDAAILIDTFRQPIRALGKAEMKSIPIFGYIYRICVVIVQRDSAESRARSVRQLKSVLRNGISILVFPEGTFNTTSHPLKDLYDGAFKIAIETQTPILPVVYPDTFSRMHYRHMFTLTPGLNRAYFLDPISVEGLGIKDVKMLKNRVQQIMSEKLIEVGAPWISDPGETNKAL